MNWKSLRMSAFGTETYNMRKKRNEEWSTNMKRRMTKRRPNTELEVSYSYELNMTHDESMVHYTWMISTLF